MMRKLFSLFIVGLLALSAYVFAVTRDLPSVEKVLRDGINPTQWTQIFASDGTPIMSFGKFKHDNIRIGEVSPHFVDALLATEDRRFYSHRGVDPIAILRAIASDLTHKKLKEGGSTLTQQLARNVFLSNERTFSRKIREAALAMQLEDKLSKDQILELYINNIYFGEGAYGIKAASEIYFGKHPSKLTISEAALLAGLPQAPSGYNPFQNPEGAKDRRNEVLANLMEVGKLSPTEFEEAKSKPVRLNPGGQEVASADKAPFFNHYVMEQVMRYYNLDEQSFWQSGLKVYTTLDLQAQTLAERAVVAQSRTYGRNRLNQQAALLSLNPKTGAIIAYVGGKNYQKSQFDRVSQATRSPGSLFKIFTYTTAIDRGYEPTRVYLDEPVKMGDWQPQNYDKSYHGYMTLARALVTSNNIVAVKVMNELGPDAVIHMAQQMGIRSQMQPYLGLTLGGSGVNLLDMTSAFGVLANQGVRVEPYAIEKIVDDSGHEVYREHPVRTDVLSRQTVDTMVKMMLGVVERGTGKAAAIGRPVAGKTGTSDDYRDAWFIGFTPDVVTGVWVGNDDNSPMPGMTGGSLPAAIWRGYMKPYMANLPVANFELAYSKPLEEHDFVSYNLKNLSDREPTDGPTGPQDGDLEEDPLLDPLAGGELPALPGDPNAGTQGDPGTPGYAGSNDGYAPGYDANNPNAGQHAGPSTVPENPVPGGRINPAQNQPANPQPMPGYGAQQGQPNAYRGGNTAAQTNPRPGYNVIPVDRPRRTRIEPVADPIGAQPQVIQTGQDNRSRSF